MYYVWVILFCSLNYVLTQYHEENDFCNLPAGQNGICKPISICPYAQNLLRNGQRPQHCGFSVYEPLVCCLMEVRRKKPNFGSSSLLNPSPGTPTGESVGALSRLKCAIFYPKPEYGILVTGGEASLAKEFPHMAIIGFGERNNIQWQCGGSLISYNFILTAAHCLSDRELGPAKWVRLGDLDLTTEEDDARPEDFTVKRSIPHPLYRPPLRYHDIALIELDRGVALSAYVSPACLNTEREVNQTRLTATGWGNTQFAGGSTSFLQKVDLDHVPNVECVKNFGSVSSALIPNGIVDDSQICAGGVIGKDTCQGDSGGPLQVHNPERTFLVRVHTLIGITSFGKACGLSKAPGIYTRISNYIPWIESVVWANENASIARKPEFKPLN